MFINRQSSEMPSSFRSEIEGLRSDFSPLSHWERAGVRGEATEEKNKPPLSLTFGPSP